SCSVLVQATMSFGGTPPGNNNVWARVSGSNPCVQLTYNAAGSGPYAGTWTGSLTVSTAGVNQLDIVVNNSCNKNTSATTNGGAADAQSTFIANSTNAATIDGVILGANGGEAPNSYLKCNTGCTATFSIT